MYKDRTKDATAQTRLPGPRTVARNNTKGPGRGPLTQPYSHSHPHPSLTPSASLSPISPHVLVGRGTQLESNKEDTCSTPRATSSPILSVTRNQNLNLKLGQDLVAVPVPAPDHNLSGDGEGGRARLPVGRPRTHILDGDRVMLEACPTYTNYTNVAPTSTSTSTSASTLTSTSTSGSVEEGGRVGGVDSWFKEYITDSDCNTVDTVINGNGGPACRNRWTGAILRTLK
ncbi:hypothetical protein AX17_004688 [Amanita inopinata Kibby_2008]|nr:hypothetical protein AX17_004688 [Amanita inopinata Kibby_2008]